MFRHEHRHFNQIARHFYVAKLYTVESLYQNSKDKGEFVNFYETGVSKLPIFKAIHTEDVDEDEESSILDANSYAEDDFLSFIEMEEDIIAFCDPDIKSPTVCRDNSSLNTTIESSQDSTSRDVANKLDSDLMNSSDDSCFNITAQLQLPVENINDLSFNSS